MGKAYFEKKDVVMRLNETICMYDGKPVYVSLDLPLDTPEHTVLCYPMTYFYKSRKDNPPFRVLYTDDKFDYKQFPLGYGFGLNHGGFYFARIPDRKQSQGLSCSTLRADGKTVAGSVFLSEVMANCINGIYPTLEEALTYINVGRFTLVPFARKMAVARIDRGLTCLKYRRRSVGIYDGKKSFKLLDIKDRAFLKTILTNEGVQVT